MPVPTDEQQWEKQRAFLREHGYLWIRDFFSQEQVLMIRKWADEIGAASSKLIELSQLSGIGLKQIAQTLPLTPIVVPEAKTPSIACRAEDLLTCYPDLCDFIEGNVTSYIGRLQGEPYVLFKDKLNFKWPGGGAFTPHQDFPAYEFLGPREHVTAMVCIDAATLENGCLQIAVNWREVRAQLAATHPEIFVNGRPILPFIQGGPQHGSIEPFYLDSIVWLQLLTSPRDLVLFDSYIPHYSEANNGTEPRRAMFLTHNRLREGEHRKAYYFTKRQDPDNPIFHIGTPTKARNKD
jgi:hypothetical protein